MTRRLARRKRLHIQPVQRWYPGQGTPWQTPNPGVFYSSRVRAKIAWWSAQRAPRLTLAVLKTGVKIDFESTPPPFKAAPLLVQPEDVDFVLQDLEKGESRGAYGPLLPAGAHYLARARVDTRANLKKRLVLNFRHVNSFVRKRSQRYDSLKDLPRVLHQNAWMITWDAASAFWHIALHKSTAHFLSFHLAIPLSRYVDGSEEPVPIPSGAYIVHPADGKPYAVVERTCTALPFGFTTSPATWAAVFKVLTKAMRRAGCRTLIWVDDGLCAMPSRAEALAARDLIEDLFQRSGLQRAPDKGVWEPVQLLPDHLGFELSTRGQGCVRVPQRRCREISTTAKDVLCRAARNARRVPNDVLERLLGQVASIGVACANNRLRSRDIYDCHTPWLATSTLSRAALNAVQFWADFQYASKDNGRPLWPLPPELGLYTDASGTLGYGAVLQHSAVPAAAYKPALARFGGFWRPEEVPFHITHKELLAVRKGVQECAPLLRGKRVLLYEDNQAVVFIIRNRVSRSPALMSELKRLLVLLDDLQITLSVRYIRSALNPADEFSRLTYRDAWGFTPRLQANLLARFQHRLRANFTLDAFACHRSAVVPRYASRFNEPGSLGPDGLALDWSNEVLWLNPPWALLPDILAKLQRTPTARGVLFCPFWPTALWWPDARDLARFEVRMPPPVFAVQHFHTPRVEPFLHPGLQLRAILFGPGIAG